MRKKTASAQVNYRMPDLSQPSPPTDANFIRDVQSVLSPKVSLKTDNKDLSSLYIDEADFKIGDSAKIKFDRTYRPFVYKILVARRDKGGLGFVMEAEGGNEGPGAVMEAEGGKGGTTLEGKGKKRQRVKRQRVRKTVGTTVRIPVKYLSDGRRITAEEVYSNVYMRLFGGKKPALLGFDTLHGRVGQGAFRSWLRMIVKSVFFEMCRVPTVVLKDIKGHIIYQRDKRGRYVLDENGKKVPCYVREVSSDQMLDDEDSEGNLTIEDTIEAPESYDARIRRGKAERDFWMAKINLRYMAYVSAFERLRKGSWFRDVLVALYEKGLSYTVVKAECLKKGVAEGTFDKAYHDWRKRYNNACEKIEETIRWKGEEKSSHGKRVPRAQLIAKEWDRLAEFVGKSRVEDIRFSVIRNLIAGFKEIPQD